MDVRGLHEQGDCTPVASGQIATRVKKHAHLFERAGNLIALIGAPDPEAPPPRTPTTKILGSNDPHAAQRQLLEENSFGLQESSTSWYPKTLASTLSACERARPCRIRSVRWRLNVAHDSSTSAKHWIRHCLSGSSATSCVGRGTAPFSGALALCWASVRHPAPSRTMPGSRTTVSARRTGKRSWAGSMSISK